MIGWSEPVNCPICGSKGSLETTGDNRPTDTVAGICLQCGFSYKTVEEQLTLDQVNEERKLYGLGPLTELKPKIAEPRHQKRRRGETESRHQKRRVERR